MQKRLSVARALLSEPVLLLVDEATHDLDPEGAERVRELVKDLARDGTAVVWATQRLDEIRGFADSVTVLNHGSVTFAGTVPDLIARSALRRYLLTLRDDRRTLDQLENAADHAISGLGALVRTGPITSRHFVLTLADRVVLGDALAALTQAGVQVHNCHSERSEIEEAFLALIREDEN